MTTNKGVHIEDDGGFQASVYMTGMILQAVKGVVGRPMEAMEFLKAIARVAADDNRPMRWTTPLGFPVNLHYAKVQRGADTVDGCRRWHLHADGTRVPR